MELQQSDSSLRLLDIQHCIDVFSLDSPPCLKTIWNILHAAGFTTKQLSMQASPRNTLEMKEHRAEWCPHVGSTLQRETAIFIDESPFSYCITRSRGRSMKGTNAITKTPQIRGKNHTVIAAISPSLGLIHYEIKITEPDSVFIRKRSKKKKKTAPKGVTRDVFHAFLINLIAKIRSPSASSSSIHFIFLFDNAAIHKGDIVHDLSVWIWISLHATMVAFTQSNRVRILEVEIGISDTSS